MTAYCSCIFRAAVGALTTGQKRMRPARNRLQGVYGAHLYEYPPRISPSREVVSGSSGASLLAQPQQPPQKNPPRPGYWHQPSAGGAGSLGTGCRAARKLDQQPCGLSNKVASPPVAEKNRRWGGHFWRSARVVGPVPRWRPPTCSVAEPGRHLLLAPALHGGGDAQRLAVFGDGAAGDVDAVALQLLDDLVVGQHARRPSRPSISWRMRWRTAFGGVRFLAVRRGDGGGEEILQLEHAARRRHVLVGGDAAHRRLRASRWRPPPSSG